MVEENKRSLITDPQDLHYISDVVNQVLDNNHELGSIKDVQTALKEVSQSRGREVQINLVFEEDKLKGFNFSFKNSPTKTTTTIPFKQQQIEMEMGRGCIVPRSEPIKALDVAVKELKGSLSIPSHESGSIVIAPGLQVEDQRIINPEIEETEETKLKLKSDSIKFDKLNPGLVNVANRLASRNDIDGLWLTGLAIKTGVTLASTLTKEKKADTTTAGLAIIKRFQQVLPQEFSQLKAGECPKSIKWKDPESGKQYSFQFAAVEVLASGDILRPASLQGFEDNSGQNFLKPVFVATLIDAKYDRWDIEQCDFNPNQIRSLGVATKPTLKYPSSVKIVAEDGFSSEI